MSDCLALSNGITFLHVNDTRSMSSPVISSVKSYLSEFLQTLLLILLAGIVSFYVMVTLILVNCIFSYRFFFVVFGPTHCLTLSFLSLTLPCKKRHRSVLEVWLAGAWNCLRDSDGYGDTLKVCVHNGSSGKCE